MDVGFAISEKVWREKKERSADYNGRLALATLEQATIITHHTFMFTFNLMSAGKGE